MRSEWNDYTLAEITSIIGGGTPKRAVEEYWNGDIPWLSVVDFNTGNRHVTTTKETITQLGLQKSSTKLLKTGQIIISARGTVGALAQLAKPMAFNQSCYGLDGKKEYVTNDYLFYLVKQKVRDLQQITHGAVFDTITRDTFKQIDVQLPPLPTQKKIAHILSTLDDKIELNRKMNETLEAMAQALFKSWFVDFDPVHAKANAKSDAELEKAAAELGISKEVLELFPSTFVESEMGMIPEGWSYDILGSICKVQSGYAFKGSWWQDTGVKVIKIKNINGIEVNTNDCQCVSQEIADKNVKFKLNHGDCLIAMTGATVGKVGIIDTSEEEFLLNQRVGRFQPAEYYEEYIKTLTKTDQFFDAIQSEAQGSAQPNISATGIEEVKIIKPSDIVIKAFAKVLQPIFTKMLFHQSEVHILQKTRDTLLPELLSGELDVSEIKI